MLSSYEKPNVYQLKKQAVFDALFKCCEVNGKGEVSLTSVLLYISKEIDSKFKTSEPLIEELNQKLKQKEDNGWLKFMDTCDIVGSWMDNVSLKSELLRKQTSVTSDVMQFLPQLSHIPPGSPSVKKTIINGLLRENSIRSTEQFSKCGSCGREENCCEWRNNEMGREEKLTRCYEQKVTELQNLLRQSEDCNSVIQLENETLRQNCIVLQNKEQRWIEKEEELKDRELQLTSANTLLTEQNVCSQKKIQHLKQQLGYLKIEHENILVHNQQLEENLVNMKKFEKLLSESKVVQSEMHLELQSKEIALSDMELKIENLQRHNQVLQEQILELEDRKYISSSINETHEESIGEEISRTFIEDESPFNTSDSDVLPVPEMSTLKDELDACWGQYPLSCEHVATQTTHDTTTSSTQTNDLEQGVVSAVSSYKPEGSIQNQMCESICPVKDMTKKYSKLSTMSGHLLLSNIKLNSRLSTSLYHNNFNYSPTPNSKFYAENKNMFKSVGLVKSSVFIPSIHKDKHTQNSNTFRSTHEMELFLVVDASTQTDHTNEEGQQSEPMIIKTLERKELTSKSEQNFGCCHGIMLLVNFPFVAYIPIIRHRWLCTLPSSRTIWSFNILKRRSYRDQLRAFNLNSCKSGPIIISSNSQIQCSSLLHCHSNGISYLHDIALLQKMVERDNVKSPNKKFISHQDIRTKDCWLQSWNPAVDITVMYERPSLMHCFQYCMIQLIMALVLWLFMPTWMLLYDDHNWYHESAFWNEVHRVLTPKLKLQWHNELPPQ